MSAREMTLRLRPLEGGAYTELRLRAVLPTAPTRVAMRRLIWTLVPWHGGPMRVVLSVDRSAAAWSEVWTDALLAVSDRHLDVRYQRRRDGDSGER